MSTKPKVHLKAIIEGCELGLVVFIGIVGVIGMIFIYAPDEIITTIYLAAMWCGIASMLIKYLGTVVSFRQSRP